MTQAGVVAWLAVRELWISFRLLAVLGVFVVAGSLVALIPAVPAVAVERLALGLGGASLFAGAAAAWSMADERRAGHAAWLVTRSLPRGGLLVGWFEALAGVTLAGLVVAAGLGWLALSAVSLRLDPGGYVSLVAGIAAAVLAAIALGLLLGTLLPSVPAVAATVLLGGTLGVAAWLAPSDPSLLPGGAYAALAELRETRSAVGMGMRAAGVGLATAALLLTGARTALERAEL